MEKYTPHTWSEDQLKEWDQRFNMLFSFPSVFSAISNVETAISNDVRGEILDTLRDVGSLIEQRVHSDQPFIAGLVPFVRRFTRLNNTDLVNNNEGNYELKGSVVDHFQRMMMDYGGIKFYLLSQIAEGPYGPTVQSVYHKALKDSLSVMANHLPTLSPSGLSIGFLAQEGGLSENTEECVFEHLFSAIMEGVFENNG
jgi:hypothetical protein|tara:strand:- start:85 stop:678 length:594 start_codon:yes stop_codon:yes gene_type:complete